MQSPPGPITLLNGREYLYFAGTGYLGLQGHPAVIAAAQQAVAQYGVHSATSRAGFGDSPPVVEVERRAAALLGAESATYLVTGYAGNFALAAALADQFELVLCDESAHDCLREAAAMFTHLVVPPRVFRHRDVDHLAELLKTHVAPGVRPIVLTDGVFAASGRLAPLAEYIERLRGYAGSALLVDDAHGLATLGASGRGSLELAGVWPDQINVLDAPGTGAPRIFHSATLSKAVGGHGGVVAGSSALLQQVRGKSGWFRGASAPAAPGAAATAKGLEIVAAEPELRLRLSKNVEHLRLALAHLGLDVERSPAPIISFRLPIAADMQRLQSRLFDDGIAIAYTRDYAGAGPAGLLRIAVFATHTIEMLDRLTDTLARCL